MILRGVKVLFDPSLTDHDIYILVVAAPETRRTEVAFIVG
jgi:hypothetical protein